jgi:perosamine synthetase
MEAILKSNKQPTPSEQASYELQIPSDQNASGRTLGKEELELLSQAIKSGTLTSTKGTFVKTLESRFAQMIGTPYAYACSSGTAAIHTAIAAIDPEPGAEIITTSITDMGALSPILYQGAIPVFADVDPHTLNVTAETIAARMSDRTAAIIVTHLFGNPCDMEPIMKLANERGIPVIEDCAQAFLTSIEGEKVGTMGTIGCFSLQQGKHITTGEGGLVTTSDATLAKRMHRFINKAWDYDSATSDHDFLALNYRLTELQGAVAVAQLSKLEENVSNRVRTANSMTEKLRGIAGVQTPKIIAQGSHTYWKYCLTIDKNVLPGGSVELGKLLKAKGIACAPRYIQKPAFQCRVFQVQKTFGKSRYPFTLARPEAVNYDAALFSGTFAALESVLVLPWNENYTQEHVDYIAEAIRQAAAQLVKAKS